MSRKKDELRRLIGRGDVMSPGHRLWRTFTVKLSDAIDKDTCNSESCRLARKVLREMGGFHVEGSIAYFKDHGGYCDCEILMNMDM